jgi:hypothetical protein
MRLFSAEGTHARNERRCIPAPVRMVRPDELPAATLGFVRDGADALRAG